MTDPDEEIRAFEAELRAKYTDAEVEALGKKGQAFKNPDGHYSYPIGDAADLSNAIKAVGRGGASHNAIRVYIAKVAKKLGLSSKIPENWAADGSLTGENAAEPGEQRADEPCPTCEGTGKILEGNRQCPDCNGTGVADGGEPEEGGERSVDELADYRHRREERLDGQTYEKRNFGASGMELRQTADGQLRFTGYASTTECAYPIADFEETIARGAFKRTLGESPDVVLLVNHDGMPLARTKSGTLTLGEDARGLRVDADLDPTDPDVQALLPKIARGDVTEMSFAFRVTDQEWDGDQRLIRSVSLHRGDVSIVTMGANEATTAAVSLRSADGAYELRIGKAVSQGRETVLKTVLERISTADDELDRAQPELAAILGVENPDQNEGTGPDGEQDAPAAGTSTDGRAMVSFRYASRASRDVELLRMVQR